MSQKPAENSASEDKGITPRAEDYSEWYLDLIKHAELADYSPVKGSMVIRPHGYALWEHIRDDLDRRIKAGGHVNAYFPLFIPLSFFAKEAQHVEGFAKECAVVTHHRLKTVPGADGRADLAPDPDAKLEEPLVVRPTSETMIWHMYGQWVDSWRDLPIKINQWANVVRWELKTRPFLRTAEFLWQEGHTAHATRDEALEEARWAIDMYATFARETLALPVVAGIKSASERFAGAEETFAIEAMMQNGWALQAGTSHFLGQNFAKAFDVTYQTENKTREHVWATSWGVSTRLVGAVIMVHSDDTGLVLPPRIAPIQCVVVPIWRKDEERAQVLSFSETLKQRLADAGVRVHIDARDGMRPGAKYFEWERKGVPLRLEVGPRDEAKRSAFTAKRTGGEKFSLTEGEISDRVPAILREMQEEVLDRASRLCRERTYECASYDDFKQLIESQGGWYNVAWHDDALAEARIKEETRATLRCFPLDGQTDLAGATCFLTGRPATHRAIFARAY